MRKGSATDPKSSLAEGEVGARAHDVATREILDLIRRLRDDAGPIFDAILHRAANLCEARAAALILGQAGDRHQRMVAQYGADPASVALYDRGEVPMDPEVSFAAEAILTCKLIHIHDLMDTDRYRRGVTVIVSTVRDSGIRTILFVPLVTENGAIGVLSMDRKEVRPYSASEIALVESFAAQAVIAIEYVRQFRELGKRVEREAASREILETIRQSREDDRPVFDVILRNAIGLCAADTAALFLARPGDERMTLVAWCEKDAPETTSQNSVLEAVNATDLRMDPALHASARAILSGEVVQIVDGSQTKGYLSGDPAFRIMVDTLGARCLLSVPLIDQQGALGVLNLHRRVALGFQDDEIALIRSFAAQAVIAIENVRQFREIQSANAELQTRLAREAATREILEVISQSRDDEHPVFDAVLRNAATLCGASMASLDIISEDRSHAVLVAHWGESIAGLIPVGRTIWPMDSDLAPPTAMREGRIVHIHDMADTDLYRSREPLRVAAVEMEGIRTFLAVPLLNGDNTVGCIEIYRREVNPFTPDEIALVQTFAAQAVIAIDNVRQFKALERLNAELGDKVEAQVGEIERMGRLKRFLPPAVADTVISSGTERILSSHRALLGVLFCDIRGFTAFCETAEPEETIEVLQTYHEEMGKLINTHGAGVDHRMGDGIMVLFNDPLPCDDPAGYAVRLAIAMRDRMAELCMAWKRLGHRLGFGVGISVGYATVGMVGFEGRFEYTASGTAINLASRLCDEAQDGEILLSPRAGIAVEDRFPIQSKGATILKGIREPVEVFKLTGGAAT